MTLKKMTASNLLLLTIDNVEQIILLVGLELLRNGLNVHFRGLAIGCAPRLDHMLNMVRIALGDDCSEGLGVTVIKHNTVTAWNDIHVNKPDHERSHMMHANLQMICGFGTNINSKMAWNGIDLEGLKVTEKETKKHLRVIKYNEIKSTVYEAPQFDVSKGTFNFNGVNWSFYENIENPLIPAKAQKPRKVFIR